MLAMSLPTGQQKVLERIEGGLAESDPRLVSLFSIFTRLALGERMPWFEQIRVRPIMDRLARVGGLFRRSARRPTARMRAMLLLPAALIAMACALTIAFGFHSSGRAVPGLKIPAGRELVVKSRNIMAKTKTQPLRIVARTGGMCRAMIRIPAIAAAPC
jgi:hypothetical protein